MKDLRSAITRENIKDALSPVKGIAFNALFIAGVLHLIFSRDTVSFWIVGISILLAGWFVVVTESNKRKRIMERNLFDVNLSKAFVENVPSSVKLSRRSINAEEYSALKAYLSAAGAAKEPDVEVLEFAIVRALALNPHPPDCCEPILLVQLNEEDYLFLAGMDYGHGIDVFGDEESEYGFVPFFRTLEVVRTRKAHIPLRVSGSGEPVHLCRGDEGNTPELNAFLDSMQKKYCEFVKRSQLPEQLPYEVG
jgi:hypothetical protein